MASHSATVAIQTAEEAVPVSRICHASCNLDPPVKSVLALSPEEVDVILELQFEDVILVNAVGLGGRCHGVAQQRQRR